MDGMGAEGMGACVHVVGWVLEGWVLEGWVLEGWVLEGWVGAGYGCRRDGVRAGKWVDLKKVKMMTRTRGFQLFFLRARGQSEFFLAEVEGKKKKLSGEAWPLGTFSKKKPTHPTPTFNTPASTQSTHHAPMHPCTHAPMHPCTHAPMHPIHPIHPSCIHPSRTTSTISHPHHIHHSAPTSHHIQHTCIHHSAPIPHPSHTCIPPLPHPPHPSPPSTCTPRLISHLLHTRSTPIPIHPFLFTKGKRKLVSNSSKVMRVYSWSRVKADC